jgi:hypothetical protein
MVWAAFLKAGRCFYKASIKYDDGYDQSGRPAFTGAIFGAAAASLLTCFRLSYLQFAASIPL